MMMMILTYFLAKTHSKLPIEDKLLIQYCCSYEPVLLKSLNCLMKELYHIFLQFLHIVEIGQKAHNTTTSRPPVSCILQILTTFLICILVDLGCMGLSVNNKQKGRQAAVRPDRSAKIWLDHWRVKMTKKVHRKQDVHQRYTKFGYITDWLRSNFGLKDKRSFIVMKPFEVKVSVNLGHSFCLSWVKVRFSSLPENMTGQTNFFVGSSWAAASYQLLQYLRGCFVLVNWITLRRDALHWLKKWH